MKKLVLLVPLALMLSNSTFGQTNDGNTNTTYTSGEIKVHDSAGSRNFLLPNKSPGDYILATTQDVGPKPNKCEVGHVFNTGEMDAADPGGTFQSGIYSQTAPDNIHWSVFSGLDEFTVLSLVTVNLRFDDTHPTLLTEVSRSAAEIRYRMTPVGWSGNPGLFLVGGIVRVENYDFPLQ